MTEGGGMQVSHVAPLAGLRFLPFMTVCWEGYTEQWVKADRAGISRISVSVER
jgi:hypothetical protein